MAIAIVKRQIVWARDKHAWREEALRQFKYYINFLSDESQITSKSESSSQKGVLHNSKANGSDNQSIIMYIHVFLINRNDDYSNSLNFFNCWRIYSWSHVYDPHKTRRFNLEVSRSRAGTQRKTVIHSWMLLKEKWEQNREFAMNLLIGLGFIFPLPVLVTSMHSCSPVY